MFGTEILPSTPDVPTKHALLVGSVWGGQMKANLRDKATYSLGPYLGHVLSSQNWL